MNFATLNRFTPLLQSPEHYGMSPPYYRGVPFFRLVSVWTALEIIVTFGGTDWGPQRADDGAARGTPAGYPARRITASLKMLYPVWALPTWPHRFPFSSPAQITPGMRDCPPSASRSAQTARDRCSASNLRLRWLREMIKEGRRHT